MSGDGAAEGRLNYIELTVGSTSASASFYRASFGWSFGEYGPTYSATQDQTCNVGLQADGGVGLPLPVVEVSDLEGALARVEGAGGVIVQPIFDFPGGRRFEFTGPDGNRMAVSTPAD